MKPALHPGLHLKNLLPYTCTLIEILLFIVQLNLLCEKLQKIREKEGQEVILLSGLQKDY